MAMAPKRNLSRRRMNLHGLSTRSKVLFWPYVVLSAVGVGIVLGLLISLGGYFIAGWQDAPIDQIVVLMINWIMFAFIPLIALRLGLAWSLKKDRLQR